MATYNSVSDAQEVTSHPDVIRFQVPDNAIYDPKFEYVGTTEFLVYYKKPRLISAEELLQKDLDGATFVGTFNGTSLFDLVHNFYGRITEQQIIENTTLQISEYKDEPQWESWISMSHHGEYQMYVNTDVSNYVLFNELVHLSNVLNNYKQLVMVTLNTGERYKIQI